MREDSLMMLRDFFENGFETMNDSVGILPLSRGHRVDNRKDGNYWSCVIYGEHTSAFAVSNTSMSLLYSYPEFLKILGVRVTSQPKANFEIQIPQSLYRFNSGPNIEDLRAVVYVSHTLYKGTLIMKGYLMVDPKTGLAYEGGITEFH